MPRGRQIGETPRHPWLQPAPRLALGADGATGPRLQVGGAGKFVEACLQVAADCAATAYPGGAVRSAGRPAQLTPATDRIYEVFSRVIDLAVAAVAVILASPIMLLAAMVIRGTSRGPVLFRQPRAGRNRASFVMYKFRTMYAGADDDKELFRRHNSLPTGPCFKMKDDPRVTTIGRWLRRMSIDELPQLFNVLKGDMALVGPRPLPLDEVVAETAEQRLRFAVKPGLTCLWQVSGRTEIPYEEWLALDVWYVMNRSLSLDVQILFKTIPAVLSCHGAY